MAKFERHHQLRQSLERHNQLWQSLEERCACRSQEYTMTGRQERDTERQNGDKAGEEGQQAAKKRSAYILAFLLE